MKKLFYENEKIAYYADADGKVFSFRKKSGKWRELKPGKNRYGYLQFNCVLNGKVKNIRVHRAVYEAFHRPIPRGLEINHRNCIRDDNRLENLEVVTHLQNNLHPPTREHAREAKRHKMRPVKDVTTGVVYESNKAAARALGLNSGSISNCCNGKLRHTGGHQFTYVMEAHE